MEGIQCLERVWQRTSRSCGTGRTATNLVRRCWWQRWQRTLIIIIFMATMEWHMVTAGVAIVFAAQWPQLRRQLGQYDRFTSCRNRGGHFVLELVCCDEWLNAEKGVQKKKTHTRNKKHKKSDKWTPTHRGKSHTTPLPPKKKSIFLKMGHLFSKMVLPSG